MRYSAVCATLLAGQPVAAAAADNDDGDAVIRWVALVPLWRHLRTRPSDDRRPLRMRVVRFRLQVRADRLPRRLDIGIHRRLSANLIA